MNFDYKDYVKLLKDNNLLDKISEEDLLECIKPFKKKEMSKCILLIRVSSGAQDLDQQSQVVRIEAKKYGYSDEDIIEISDTESGSKLDEEFRNGLTKLKEAIDNDSSIDCVFCYEISRISRQTKIVYSIRDFLISHNVNLVCCNPYFKLLKDDGTLSETASIVFGIFASLAEQETYLRVQRITRGKKKKEAEGKLACGKPIFGYTVDKDHYVIPYKKESEIVKEIFERYVNKRESTGIIAKDLYLRKAFRDDSTKVLTIQNYVCVVLREQRYTGSNPIYPALIPKELFDKAEQIRKAGKNKFTRKSLTKEVYPLQGYIYTTDNYLLTIGITNNRYLKMNDAAVKRISLNMSAMHELTKYVITKYIESGAGIIDIENERKELDRLIQINTIKMSSIDDKIEEIRKENDFIQTRIIKRRISESKGDSMIDENLESMKKLSDERVTLEYQISQAKNKLFYISNPLLNDYEEVDIKTNEDLRKYVEKYLKKIVAEKVKFSTYRLDYYFLDGKVMTYHFYNTCHRLVMYDKDMKEIK